MIALMHMGAIAVFLTNSYRLVPMPLSDTSRAVLVTALILALGLLRHPVVSLEYLRRMSPYLLALALSAAFSLVLGRLGYFSMVHLTKTACLVGVGLSAAQLPTADLRRIVMLATALLFVQYVWLELDPGSFARMGRKIGIEDSFVVYGSELDRTYFAYFHANIAAYSIFCLIAAWLMLSFDEPVPSLLSAGVLGVLTLFALMTGGRGVLLLMAGLYPALVFLRRRSSTLSLAIGLPLFAALGGLLSGMLRAVVGMREESNDARVDAMKDYVGFVADHPLFGVGIDTVGRRVSSGDKPSHFLYLELVGIHGIVLGAIIAIWLVTVFVIRPRRVSRKAIGISLLAAGFFNNTLLMLPTFLPLALVAFQQAQRRNAVAPSHPMAGVRHA